MKRKRPRVIRETITLLVDMRVEYDDIPGARRHAIRSAKECPYDVVGAHVLFGGYSVRRGKIRLAPPHEQQTR